LIKGKIKGSKNRYQFMPDLVELCFERCELFVRIWQGGLGDDEPRQWIDLNGSIPNYDLYRPKPTRGRHIHEEM